jgi:ABC-2 type transport system ATP-binding protein
MDSLPDSAAVNEDDPMPASEPAAPEPVAIAVEINHATKRFGDTRAVDDVSFTIGQGQLFGFIGPNGAGKTTTMKMLATLIRPDRGQLRVMGNDVVRQDHEVRRLIGYMPDVLGAYPDITVWEYLDFFGAAYGIPSGRRRSVIDELLQLVDLVSKVDALVGGLSRGMQQRLGLARALVHDPKVLLLDEPASGLDPRARIELRAILQELRSMGKTILLSSHILTELAEICTHIGIIEQGKMVYVGGTEEALQRVRAGRNIEIKVLGDTGMALRTLQALEQVESVDEEDDTLVVVLPGSCEDITFLVQALADAGLGLASMQERAPSLEEAFMNLTEGVVS